MTVFSPSFPPRANDNEDFRIVGRARCERSAGDEGGNVMTEREQTRALDAGPQKFAAGLEQRASI